MGKAGRLDPAVVSARRRAAGIAGAADRWGRATNGEPRPTGRGRAARNAAHRTHQLISVPVVETFHTATPRADLRPDRAWYQISNEVTGGAVDVWIYDEIGWFGVTAQDFVLELAGVQATALNVHLNSPGGEVFDGIAIYNALVNHPATVNVTVDALAASIASVIAMAGDTVTMGRHSQLMIHEPYGMCLGNADDMQSMIEQLDRCADNIAGVYADRAGGTVEAWREAMRAESWYTGAEAVAAGLADQVIANPRAAPDPDEDDDDDTEGPPEDVSDRWDLSVFSYAGRQEAPTPDLTVRSRPKLAARAAGAAPAANGDRPAPIPPSADPAPAAPPDHASDPTAALIALTVLDHDLFAQQMKEAAG